MLDSAYSYVKPLYASKSSGNANDDTPLTLIDVISEKYESVAKYGTISDADNPPLLILNSSIISVLPSASVAIRVFALLPDNDSNLLIILKLLPVDK
jgi:hypothetical protein